MNTLVMFKTYSHVDVEKSNNITIVNTQKSLEEFKSSFDEAVSAFVKKIMELNVFVNEANRDLKQEDFDTESEKVKNFTMHYDNLENFKKENYVFEFEGQFIDMKNWFWNDEILYEYEIYYLEDWVKIKQEESQKIPEYNF